MPAIRKTITLGEQQEAWIKRQTASGPFSNDSEYICDLVNRDQQGRDAHAQLRAAIEKGLNSGISDRSFDEIWEEGITLAREKRA